ncbi:MAG: hypothetical protein M3R36_01825 [Bacteroidota bacterium]|nr:hypothetical protein [Bacteroidota bacterium]
MNKTRTQKEVKESIYKGLNEAISISQKLAKQKNLMDEEVVNTNSKQSKKYLYNQSSGKEMVRDKKTK